MAARADELRIYARWDGRGVNQGIQQTEQDLSRLRRVTDLAKGAAVGLGAGFGAFIALDAARAVTDLAGEMAELHSRTRAVRIAFENLTTRNGTNPIDFMLELSAAANGTRSDLELMALSNKAINSEVRSLYENLASVIADTRAVSTSLGRNAAEDINRVVEAITKCEQELLDELGIVARVEQANIRYAASVGKVATELTDLEQREAFAILVTEELGKKAEAVGRPNKTRGYEFWLVAPFVVGCKRG